MLGVNGHRWSTFRKGRFFATAKARNIRDNLRSSSTDICLPSAYRMSRFSWSRSFSLTSGVFIALGDQAVRIKIERSSNMGLLSSITLESASYSKSQLDATTAFSSQHVNALYIMRSADEDFIRRIMIMDDSMRSGGGIALPGLRQS